MIESEKTVTTKRGNMPAFCVHPEGERMYPVVILLMDAPGIREELRNHARRIAKQGYYCVLPDLYYRYGTIRFDLPHRDDAMSGMISAAFRGLTDAGIAEDVSGLLSFIDAQQHAAANPVGIIGYCMSGRYVTTLAAAFPHRIKAGASLYGVRLVTDTEDSPHLHLNGIKADLYYAFGETDKSSTPDIIEKFSQSLAEAKVKHDVEVFAGADHGFMFGEGRNYAPMQSEQAWAKVLALLSRNLK